MKTFKYGKTEIDYLKMKDSILGIAIERIGMVEREVNPELFPALINSIVSQQISTKAATTVWNRMLNYFGDITPGTIASATIEEIQKCGLSMRKAVYIKSIAEAEVNGELELSEFPKLSDEEIIGRLTALNGIGTWTAEMLLIHSMKRPDVISWGDLAIRRGIMKLYGLQSLTKKEFEEYRERYSPHGTVASIYLWKIAHEYIFEDM